MQKLEKLSWLALVLAVPSVGWSAQTMTGTISDSQCGASHAKMIAMHKDMPLTEKQCTEQCVKMGGKYVFVSNGKVYTITNQDFTALAQHAGEAVSLRGTVEGDAVTVTKIAATKTAK
jgi:hypothetical protein